MPAAALTFDVADGKIVTTPAPVMLFVAVVLMFPNRAIFDEALAAITARFDLYLPSNTTGTLESYGVIDTLLVS